MPHMSGERCSWGVSLLAWVLLVVPFGCGVLYLADDPGAGDRGVVSTELVSEVLVSLINEDFSFSEVSESQQTALMDLVLGFVPAERRASVFGPFALFLERDLDWDALGVEEQELLIQAVLDLLLELTDASSQ